MPDPSQDAKALVSLIGRALGFSTLPLIGAGEQPPLLPAGEAGTGVAGADSISGPVKLDLLTHITKSALPESVYEPVAVSLLQPGLGGEVQAGVVEEVLARTRAAEPGTDPFGRLSTGLGGEIAVLRHLKPEIQQTLVSLLPRCEATETSIDGYPALNLVTVITSHRPIDDMRAMVDPREWPHCPVQASFFKSMGMVTPAAPPMPDLASPDAGWSARLSEVVDFSYGLDPSGASIVTTDLDFVYFDSRRTVGCTYDLGFSHEDKIKVDRGYVLVEDLESLDVRRTTTLKQVYLVDNPQPGSQVCLLWSLAQAMIAASCQTRPHPAVRSAA